MSNQPIDIIVDPSIIGLATQLIDGYVSVTAFVDYCRQYKWTVSYINVTTGVITICQDSGETDENLFPIVVWKDINLLVAKITEEK